MCTRFSTALAVEEMDNHARLWLHVFVEPEHIKVSSVVIAIGDSWELQEFIEGDVSWEELVLGQ